MYKKDNAMKMLFDAIKVEMLDNQVEENNTF